MRYPWLGAQKSRQPSFNPERYVQKLLSQERGGLQETPSSGFNLELARQLGSRISRIRALAKLVPDSQIPEKIRAKHEEPANSILDLITKIIIMPSSLLGLMYLESAAKWSVLGLMVGGFVVSGFFLLSRAGKAAKEELLVKEGTKAFAAHTSEKNILARLRISAESLLRSPEYQVEQLLSKLPTGPDTHVAAFRESLREKIDLRGVDNPLSCLRQELEGFASDITRLTAELSQLPSPPSASSFQRALKDTVLSILSDSTANLEYRLRQTNEQITKLSDIEAIPEKEAKLATLQSREALLAQAKTLQDSGSLSDEESDLFVGSALAEYLLSSSSSAQDIIDSFEGILEQKIKNNVPQPTTEEDIRVLKSVSSHLAFLARRAVERVEETQLELYGVSAITSFRQEALLHPSNKSEHGRTCDSEEAFPIAQTIGK